MLEAPARLDEARRELDRYFAGELREFDLPIDWSLSHGFRQRVLQGIAAIPYGETRTYTEMATGAGNPRAVRAAGSACGSNPIPLVVPCHRVLRLSGGLGGYAGGLAMKESLLELEAVRAGLRLDVPALKRAARAPDRGAWSASRWLPAVDRDRLRRRARRAGRRSHAAAAPAPGRAGARPPPPAPLDRSPEFDEDEDERRRRRRRRSRRPPTKAKKPTSANRRRRSREEACEEALEDEEEAEDAEAEECRLDSAEATVAAVPGRDEVRLTVRYRTFEPSAVAIDLGLRGGKGALDLGTESARFGRSGTLHADRDAERPADGAGAGGEGIHGRHPRASTRPTSAATSFERHLTARNGAGAGMQWSDPAAARRAKAAARRS